MDSRSTPALPLVAVTALCLALLGACSGRVSIGQSAEEADAPRTEPSDDGTGEGGAVDVLTRDEYVARFSEVCRRVSAEVDGFPEPEGYDQLAGLAARAEALTADGVAELRALTPPEEVAAEMAAVLDLLASDIDNFADLGAAARAEDDAALRDVVAARQALRDELRTLIDPLGIDCGLGGEEGAGAGEEPTAASTTDPAEPADQPDAGLPAGTPASPSRPASVSPAAGGAAPAGSR